MKPEASPIKRLSKREYLNTLRDLLKPLSTTVQSTLLQQINAAAELLPEDSGGQFDNFDSKISENHISSYYEIANLIARAVVANKQQFFSSCFQTVPVAESCVRSFISDFGLKTHRRPLDQTEVDQFYTFYLARGTTGIEDLIARFFLTPDFLYHLENRGTPIDASDELALSSYEIASRLSYLYWESMPNDLLFSAAKNGELGSEEGLKQVIEQLFISEKSRIKISLEHYVSDWLEFDTKPGFEQSPRLTALANLVPGIGTPDSALRAEMLQELLDLTSHYIWETPGGRFEDIITSDVSFAKGDRLAALYGVQKWAPGQPMVRFPASERTGLFTRAGSLYSGTAKTSPIKYGVTTIRNVLCDKIPDPPQEVIDDALRNPNIDFENLTQRQIVHQMTSPSNCVACHSVINPYGFAIEAYNAFGVFRRDGLEHKFNEQGTLVNSLPIDSSTEIKINPGLSLNVANAVEMSASISESGKAHSCFVRNYYRYSQRRNENEGSDHCGMERMYKALTEPGGGLKSMFKSMGSDPSFLRKRIAQ